MKLDHSMIQFQHVERSKGFEPLRRPAPKPPPVPAVGAEGLRLVAKHPNHVWMIVFTKVGGLLRSVFGGAVIDAYSRKVLAIAVAPHEPSAAFAVRLLREAVRDNGAPRLLVSDHGKQLTATSSCRSGSSGSTPSTTS